MVFRGVFWPKKFLLSIYFFFFLKFIIIKRFWHLNHWNRIKIQCSMIFCRNRVILIGFIRNSGVPLYIRTWAKNVFFQLFWCFWVQICQKVDFNKMLFRWSLTLIPCGEMVCVWACGEKMCSQMATPDNHHHQTSLKLGTSKYLYHDDNHWSSASREYQ